MVGSCATRRRASSADPSVSWPSVAAATPIRSAASIGGASSSAAARSSSSVAEERSRYPASSSRNDANSSAVGSLSFHSRKTVSSNDVGEFRERIAGDDQFAGVPVDVTTACFRDDDVLQSLVRRFVGHGSNGTTPSSHIYTLYFLLYVLIREEWVVRLEIGQSAATDPWDANGSKTERGDDH